MEFKKKDAISSRNFGLENEEHEQEKSVKTSTKKIRRVVSSPSPGKSKSAHKILLQNNNSIAEISEDLENTPEYPDHKKIKSGDDPHARIQESS